MPAEQRVLVTGASGFVGGWVAEALQLTGLATPRAGIRAWSRAARIARFPMEIVLCDILDQDQVADAVAGVQAVVHCAYTDSRDSIVQGTHNLLEAAHRAGVERFVFLSTAEVYGQNVHGRIEEDAPYGASGGEYADSKVEAERLCWSYLERGLPVTILRPSIVYGPFSGRTVNLAMRLQSGNWGQFKDLGDGTCNLVYIEDLVSAIFLALNDDAAVGEAFNIVGPEVVTWNQYFRHLNRSLELPDLQELPTGTTTLKSFVRDRVSQVTGFFLTRYGDRLMEIYLRNGAARLVMQRVKQALFTTPSSRELQDLYSRKAHYPADKAQRLLGYSPRVDLDAGNRLSVQWLSHHGFTTAGRTPDEPGQTHPPERVPIEAPEPR